MLKYDNISELDELLLWLLKQGLVLNEYRQQNKQIDTELYNELLDTAINITKVYRDYFAGMNEIFSEVDKIKSR